MKKHYHSHGKLLLSGEYVVLDGAVALTVPTQLGQSLTVLETDGNGIEWSSYDEQHRIWFHTTITIAPNGDLFSSKLGSISETLLDLLRTAKRLNPKFLCDRPGLAVETRLEFPRNWGLGSSSTLINNIAQWAKVDAYTLLEQSFGGSGYDIAAAKASSALLYRRGGNKGPLITPLSLSWPFSNSLFFVYLNRKQDSREGIANYRKTKPLPELISRISGISMELAHCASLAQCEKLLDEHERILSSLLGMPTVKERLFPDYPYSLKSLGAWGGDFILAVGGRAQWEYFKEKGYRTLIPFQEMVLS